MEQLVEIGKKAIDHAQKLGIDEAEIYLYTEKHISAKFVGGIFASRSGAVKGFKGVFARMMEPWIKKKGLPIIRSGIKAGVGIRAIANKAIGFSSVSSIAEKQVLEAVEQAIKIAKIRPPDPNWVALPEPEEPSPQGATYDEKVSDLDVDDTLRMCVDCCVAGGDFDKRIVNVMSMVLAASTSFAVVNTRGVEAFDRGTVFAVFADFKAKASGDEVSAGDFIYSRTLAKDLPSFAVSVARRAVECLGRKALPEKYVGPVVFENTSWTELFTSIFTYGVSASNVQESRSVYKGKVGEGVADEKVSVVDDGTLPDGLGTAGTDDEGVARRRTPVIEKGVLSGFLHNNYSAKRDNIESTGNASRQRTFGSVAYANQPIISPSNLILASGKGDLSALLGEVRDCVLVKGSMVGSAHSNAVTGDFSVTAGTAFKVENGAVAYPLKPCTVAGNLYGSLNAIIALGSDLKVSGNVICPSVVVDKIVVST
jgi:PmbA protein